MVISTGQLLREVSRRTVGSAMVQCFASAALARTLIFTRLLVPQTTETNQTGYYRAATAIFMVRPILAGTTMLAFSFGSAPVAPIRTFTPLAAPFPMGAFQTE